MRTRRYSDSTYLAPGTKTESMIAQVWQELPGLEEVGKYHNFIDRAGHLLLSVRVIAVLNKNTGGRISSRINSKELIPQTLNQIALAIEEQIPLAPRAGPSILLDKLSNGIRRAEVAEVVYNHD